MGEGFIVRRGVKAPEQPTPSVFLNATGGTTLEYDLDSKRYRSHTFTSNGTFEVTQLSNLEDFNIVDYLVIGGGGGRNNSSGGGAGGYRTTNGISGGNSAPEPKVIVTETSYSITIGAGGPNATNGDNSSIGFPNPIISLGGGAGGSQNENGNSGGSGGGADRGGFDRIGGAGTVGQGFKGGNVLGEIQNFNTVRRTIGGGGGAGGPSPAGRPTTIPGNTTKFFAGSVGGPGLFNSLRTGFPEPRAGGGDANSADMRGVPTKAAENPEFISQGVVNLNEMVSLGRHFGGGYGVRLPSGPTVGLNAVINTGGGGSPSTDNAGSGIVVIRYEIATV